MVYASERMWGLYVDNRSYLLLQHPSILGGSHKDLMIQNRYIGARVHKKSGVSPRLVQTVGATTVSLIPDMSSLDLLVP